MHYVNTRGIAIANATACNCIGAVLQLQRSSNGEAMMLLHCLAMEWQWSGNGVAMMLLQYRANTLCQYAPIQRVLTLYLVPIQRVLIQLQYRANTGAV